ncbi:MAG: hypothetical protein IKP40_13250 [Clostridia bacterium]|nr:hypothetical protein [Clostridia bacterium]
MLKRIAALLMALLLALPCWAAAEDEEEDLTIEEYVILGDDGEEYPDEPPARVLTPRDDFINRIIDLGHTLYVKANGKAQKAASSSDIYVCKNFTTYLFRKNRDDFRMAAYPNVTLKIPDNLPAKQCKPYYYGLLWKDVPASEGNPFYIAAEFRYDSSLSAAENLALAEDFMREVKRGDFFQMSADYQYGIGAHSAIMIEDYDPATDTVTWMDSNMRGKKVNGVRYGIVQYAEVKDVTWWASAFCKKKRGATIYRLRDDIVYAADAQ